MKYFIKSFMMTLLAIASAVAGYFVGYLFDVIL